MKVGILGTGDVGRALGKGFITLGHEVKLGARTPANEKAVGWAKEMGANASAGTFADAAGFGDVVVVATLGAATEAVLAQAGPERFAGKVVIDTTNPLDFSKGMPPTLAYGHSDSAGERIQRALPKARVVKAFNIVGNARMFRPEFSEGAPDMLICGNDEAAKREVTGILKDFGWSNVTDVGGIEGSRYLEPMCIMWVLYGARNGVWSHAFKVVKK